MQSTRYSREIKKKISYFSKNIKISNFVKIRPLGSELFHVDWQAREWTDILRRRLKTELRLAMDYCVKTKTPRPSVMVFIRGVSFSIVFNVTHSKPRDFRSNRNVLQQLQ